MNFKRLLHTQLGIVIISILLGLGLATLFRKVCTDKNCIVFNGPVISETDGKTYRYDEKCYKYKMEAAKCDKTKRTIDISAPNPDAPVSMLGNAPQENKEKGFFGF